MNMCMYIIYIYICICVHELSHAANHSKPIKDYTWLHSALHSCMANNGQGHQQPWCDSDLHMLHGWEVYSKQNLLLWNVELGTRNPATYPIWLERFLVIRTRFLCRMTWVWTFSRCTKFAWLRGLRFQLRQAREDLACQNNTERGNKNQTVAWKKKNCLHLFATVDHSLPSLLLQSSFS